MPPAISITRDLVLLAIASLAAPVLNAVAMGAMLLAYQDYQALGGLGLVMVVTAILAVPATLLLGFPIARLLYSRGRLSAVQLIVLSSCVAMAIYLAIIIVHLAGNWSYAVQLSRSRITREVILVFGVGALGAGVALVYLWLRRVWGGGNAASV